MIAVDTNILVACVRTEYPHHDKALEHIRDLAEDSTAWALPWACVHEFLAVVTNPPRIFRVPLAASQAAEVIAAICITHGVTELWTADRDFGRFPALRIRNPCA